MIQSGIEIATLQNKSNVIKSKDCIICSNKNSSYKCPKCHDRYCCSACYQQHKAKCIFSIQPVATRDEKNSNNDDNIISVNTNNPTPTIESNNVSSLVYDNHDECSNIANIDNTTTTNNKNNYTTIENDISTNINGDESIGILSNINNKNNDDIYLQDSQLLHEDMKKKLYSSKELVSRLKSKRLRKDIVAIDSSQDRSNALKNIRQNNKEFDLFLTSIVDIINS